MGDTFALPAQPPSRRFDRQGLNLAPSTLGDTVRGVANLLLRIVAAMRVEQLAGSMLQADDTGLPVLDGESGHAVSGRLWVYLDRRHVVYDFTPTKHGAGPAAYLQGFQGLLLADGGSEFKEAVARMGLTRAGCWSHARRHFVDAEETSPALAGYAIAQVAELFAIERRPDMADIEVRARTRATETRNALNGLHAWLKAQVHTLRPRSPIGRAVHYALNQWPYLSACADNPDLPIHNNASELHLRRPVIRRKNWLFAGSEGGAKSAATLFSLTASCRLHGIDPGAYLVGVLARINDHPAHRVSEFTPAAWAGK